MISEEQKIAFIQQLEQKLELQFKNEINSGNLCFVNNNDEMQDEFKQSFNEKDFECFLNSFENSKIHIPADTLSFWQLVEKGKRIM